MAHVPGKLKVSFYLIAENRCSYWLPFKMGHFSASLFACLPAFIPLHRLNMAAVESAGCGPNLTVLPTSWPWLLLFISSLWSVSNTLIHCCLHEYYRILLFSSNLSLSLFLNILNIYLLCVCMNVYWHMHAWSPQYICGGHVQSLFTPSILWMPSMDELRSTGIFITELSHWPFYTYLLCCICESIEDLCTFYSFFLSVCDKLSLFCLALSSV